ncbi:ABC transporter substrate-binding protein [Streptomyces sp. NBC_01239]|uniref:ABC transporter substrate-binding protein n=1 Tax=Streptomyces sp. NBC_01239 TaxID=2903792 RepID=UPI00224D8165|nr:ABC transporter substrate-binding protein [Streptomyces sp. NBC_01239]MCX4817976.1 ABC transporter substrate-binding protein [Streptomyces sp. NBC_01239]
MRSISSSTGSTARAARTVVGVVAAGALMAACSNASNAATSTNGDGTTTITVSQPFTSTLNSALYLADSKGYFKKNHLKVKFVTVSSGAGLAATLGGSAQIALVSSVLPMNALQQGQKFDIFAASGLGFPESVLVSKAKYEAAGLTANSTLKQKMQFLADKPIAVESPTGENSTVFKYLFDLAGLPTSSFKPTVLGNPAAILAAVKNGKAIGTALGSPYPQQAVADGYGMIPLNLSAGDVPQMQNILTLSLATTPSYYKAHPEIIKEFTAALQEGQDYLYANTADAAKYMAGTYFSSAPESAVLAGITAQRSGGAIAQKAAISKESVANLVKFMNATGQKTSPDYLSIFPTLSGS